MKNCGFFGAAIAGLILSTGSALAEPVTYTIDSNHTYPAFAADHLGGVSLWRGKITSTSGTVVLDKEQQAGSVDVTMDMSSIDFGHDGLNDHAKEPEIFDVAQFPTATYTGQLTNFRDGVPTAVEGELTLHGVTQPVTLTIDRFLCKQHPMARREVCGADATATIDRSDFGVSYGQPLFDMAVTLKISIEALAPES
jgi:polyisoprenoid-binding protein YceI